MAYLKDFVMSTCSTLAGQVPVSSPQVPARKINALMEFSQGQTHGGLLLYCCHAGGLLSI